MLENPNFKQNYYSRRAMCMYKNGHDSFRLLKRFAYYDRYFHENINYYDLMRSVLKYLNEIS